MTAVVCIVRRIVNTLRSDNARFDAGLSSVGHISTFLESKTEARHVWLAGGRPAEYESTARSHTVLPVRAGGVSQDYPEI